TFFRGALLTAILRTRGVVTAVVMSSLFYAALHFVHTKSVAISGEPGWHTGLVVLFGSFHKFTELSTLDSFLALFMAGIFLCTVRLRRGNIAFCIGIHAGWVMVIKLMKTYTHHLHDSEYAFLIGEYDGIIGYLALFFISTIALVYYLATTQKHHYFTGKG
ncbi:MAG: CPBP family intramembrane metalloprotease, partial [Gammaproteobacteria bacterium]|nr:CPBP family intramembrane metalloprotease [Gammaproteobacteria bacterium]